MKRWFLATAVLLGGTAGIASADYIVIIANVGQVRDKTPPGAGNIGMPPGMGNLGFPPGMANAGAPPGLNPGGAPNPGNPAEPDGEFSAQSNGQLSAEPDG
jgi:hypothetical protein